MIGLHEINNHLGHAKGDSALCELADAMRACFDDTTGSTASEAMSS
ncbi:MAG: hypothetical protein ACLT3W_01730 [Bifidobacterium pseudocatenulatum]